MPLPQLTARNYDFRVSGSEAERGFDCVRIEQQAQGVRGAGDEDMRVNQRIDSAALAVINGDRQAAGFHRREHQSVVVPVAQCRNMPQIEFPGERALLDVLPFRSQHVGQDDFLELLMRGTVRISRDDFDIDELREVKQQWPHARTQFPVTRKRARVIADNGVDDALAESRNLNRNAGLSHRDAIIQVVIPNRAHAFLVGDHREV